MSGEELPVHVLYDADKVDENSNIEPGLVVPIGHCRSRSEFSHRVGQRLFEILKAKNPNDPRLRALAIEDPRAPGPNHIDSIVQSVLRLSRGIRGFGSTQAQAALAARPVGGSAQGMVPSLTATNPQTPGTTVQIAVQAAQDAGREAKPHMRRLVGLNGR